MDDHRFKHPSREAKRQLIEKGIFKTGIMPLGTCFTERGLEAIQLHASDLPQNIRSLSKISAANILSRLGASIISVTFSSFSDERR